MRRTRLFELFPALTAALLGGSAVATAQTANLNSSGYYARLDAGWAKARGADASGGPVAGYIDELGDSPVIGVGFGYRFNRNLRADVTTSYGWGYELNDRDRAGTQWTADVDAWTTMANLYLEYPMGNWSPYAMVGAGVSRNRVGTLTGSNGASVAGDTKTSFAWQAGLGVGYAIDPSWTLDLSYRYLDAGEFETASTSSTPVGGDLRTHLAMLGVRYSFGTTVTAPRPIMPAAAAPPPPVAAPVASAPPAAPAGPQLPVTYMVFFDWDRSEISEGSERILRDAASTSKRVPVTRIVATGHADRSGPDRYNMALSLRRANAVRAILIREGVPENQIVVLGAGERQPLVPTADGTREPRNRRVEIVLE